MTLLYQKLNVPNLKDIQEEVLTYIMANNVVRPQADDEYFVQMDYSKFPKLHEFVFSRTLTNVVETSSCFLPGHKKLMTHIDGLKKNNGKVPADSMLANQWVMIIPIANTEQTISYWFKNEDVADEDEIIVNRVRPEPPYNFYVSFAKSELELQPIGSTVIDQVTFIKSDIYHTVVNNSPDTRMVFIVRFKEEKKRYTNPEEIFDYKDLI
jgi:hypothetical protein